MAYTSFSYMSTIFRGKICHCVVMIIYHNVQRETSNEALDSKYINSVDSVN